MILFIDVIVMPTSFFIAYFMNDTTTIVNHDLILYGMFLFLVRIEQLSPIIINRSWNLLLYVVSMKDRNPAGKYCSTSSGFRSLFFVILYNFSGIGKQFLISGSIF